MTYRVVVVREVVESLAAYRGHIALERHAPIEADRWLERAFAVLDSLAEWPERFELDESASAYFGVEIRRRTFDSHSFFYTVDEPGMRVTVLRLQHAAMRRPGEPPEDQ